MYNTCHIREHENTFVEVEAQQVVLEMLEDAHTNKYGERTVPQQERVP